VLFFVLYIINFIINMAKKSFISRFIFLNFCVNLSRAKFVLFPFNINFLALIFILFISIFNFFYDFDTVNNYID